MRNRCLQNLSAHRYVCGVIVVCDRTTLVYQGVCYEVGALIDAAVARRLGEHPEQSPRWARICQHFTMATKLEVSFWDMGLKP